MNAALQIMDIPLVNLIFTLEKCAGSVQPFALFGSRLLFPAAFRRAVGCAPQGEVCDGGADCPCRITFSQMLTPDPAALRRYQKASLPFAFRFPLLPENMQKGDITEFSLTLVGVAVNHLEIYLAAVKAVLPATFRLLAIDAVAADGGRKTLSGKGGKVDVSAVPISSFEEIMSGSFAITSSLAINFLTPLRLMQSGAPLSSPSFPALAGALFRRISSLAYYYGGVELPYDFKWLAARSREVACRSEGFKWLNLGGSLQGCSGEICCEGELTDILPFLLLGQYLNLGKGASYGMGSYTLSSG